MKIIIDDNFKYCPGCQEEYTAKVSFCAECSLELVSAERMRVIMAELSSAYQEDMVAGENTDWTEIASGSLFNMKELKNCLRSKGVFSVLFANPEKTGNSCCGTTVSLLVGAGNIKKAEQIVFADNLLRTGCQQDCTSTIVDFNNSEVVCPACGYKFSSENNIACPDCGLCF